MPPSGEAGAQFSRPGAGPRSIASNVSALALGEIAARVMAAGAGVYLARTLGPSTFGVLGLGSALFSYCLLVIDGGHSVLAVRDILRGGDRRTIVGLVLCLRLVLSLCVLASLWIVAPRIAPDSIVSRTLVLYGLTGVSFALTLNWVYQALGDMRLSALISAVRDALYALGVVMLVRAPGDVLRVPVWRAASEGVAAVALFVLLGRQIGWPRPATDPRALVRFLRTSLPFGASRLLRSLIYNIDILLLGWLTTSAVVGLYSAGYAIVYGLLMLNVFFSISVVPMVVRSIGSGTAETRAMLARFHRMGATLALPLATGGSLLAAPIFAFLYGPDYQRAASYFAVLIWSTALIPISENFRRVLMLSGRERHDMNALTLTLLVNVGANLFLIPRYGALGAAVATLGAEFFLVIVAWILVTRFVGRTAIVSPMVPALIGAAAMAAVVYPLRHVPLYVSIPAGAAVYALIVLPMDRELRATVATAVAGMRGR